MDVLFVTNADHAIAHSASAMMSMQGIRVSSIAPRGLSAFTAYKIAKAIDDNPAIRVVVAYDNKDGMAAVSARKIARRSNYKVIVAVQPNSDVPKALPSQLREGIDAWIFPTERLKRAYPAQLKNSTVIPPLYRRGPYKGIRRTEFEAGNDAREYLWCGPIDHNTERLKQAIEAIDKAGVGYKLVIIGTGRALDVMPAVRLSRSIFHPERVEWKGDNYDFDTVVNNAFAIVQSSPDPIETELHLLSQGWPMVQPGDVGKDVSEPEGEPDTTESTALDLIRYINEII